MSNYAVCGSMIRYSDRLNSTSYTTTTCDLQEGHEGDHSAMFYHCAKRVIDPKSEKPVPYVIDNYRLGRITWKDELSVKK